MSTDIFNYKFEIVIGNDTSKVAENYNKQMLLKDLVKDGIILTPQDYTNNIVNYYNTALGILTALIIIFSVVTYFHIRFMSKQQINEVFKEVLKDSKEFETNVLNAVFGRADSKFASIERADEIETRLREIDIEEIINRLDQLESKVNSEGDQTLEEDN